MMQANIRDKENNVVGNINLPENIFGVQVDKDVLHTSVVNFLANQRQGTHATKTKGLVSGGGKKPYKQKKTGRARAGSSRSPLWRGGGIIFGPQPRDYSYKIPRKVKRLALKTALSSKHTDGAVIVMDNFSMEKPRTREMVGMINKLGLERKSILIVVPEKNENVMLSARNIPGVRVMRAADLNSYDVMTSDSLLITRDALSIIGQVEKI